jgi:hypothetical protein
VQRSLYVASGPWAVHLLDLDPAGCWSLMGAKAGDAAVGRAGTLALARAADALGGVNADFFSLTAPQGVPTGLHVQNGVVITGPSARPSFVVDAKGGGQVTVARVHGSLVAGSDTLALVAWNRAAPKSAEGVALYDRAYGPRTDSIAGRLFLHVARTPGDPSRATVVALDSGSIATIGADEIVFASAPNAPAAILAGLRRVAQRGGPVRVTIALDPAGITQAVSGSTVLVQDGALPADVDTSGAAGFRARNPRTAVAITTSGHVLLVIVDGRQPGYSDGMSLRELGELLRALGARSALNLDGGGSTTLVARDATGMLRIVNKPSDKEGERPVGNALLVRSCRR